MPYCYSHRSAPHSTLTREASFWERWELTWRHTTGRCTENQSLWSTHSGDVFIKPLPSWLRNLYGKGSKKMVRTRGGRWFQGSSFFSRQQDCHACDLTETVAPYTWPIQVPGRWGSSTEKGEQICSPASNQEAVWNWYQLVKGKIIVLQ